MSGYFCSREVYTEFFIDMSVVAFLRPNGQHRFEPCAMFDVFLRKARQKCAVTVEARKNKT